MADTLTEGMMNEQNKPSTVQFIDNDWLEARIIFTGNNKIYQALKKHLIRGCIKHDISYCEGWLSVNKSFFFIAPVPDKLRLFKKRVTAYCKKRNIELTH